MAKYYAVKIGRKAGIYRTWTEAQAQVKGFPNAKFKSFPTEAEAKLFMGEAVATTAPADGYQAYVDGSFNKALQQYGSGVVILKAGQRVHEISVAGNEPAFLDSYQIAGEIIAALEAIKWGIANSLAEISIFYDYQGIAAWALGEWSANKAVSKFYQTEFAKLKNQIKVHFVKVKGHSGDEYNDVADGLAGKAASTPIK